MQLKAPEKSRRKVFKMQALTHMTQFSINEEKRKMAFQEQLSSFKKQVRDQQEDHRRRFEESQRARRKEFDDIEYGRDERESRAIQDRQQEFEDAEKMRRKQTFEFRDTLLAAADNLNIQSRAQFEEWRGNVVEKVLVENLSRWERMFAEGPYSQTFLGGL